MPFKRSRHSIEFRFGILAGTLLAFSAWATDLKYWPQFRGPTGQGTSDSAHPPVQFSVSNPVWKTELPLGHSSPCVWGNRIFLTTYATNQLECRAYDRRSGRLLWARRVAAENVESTHEFNHPASSTPAADGSTVVFQFHSYGLLAYSHQGKLLWERKLPTPVAAVRYGSGSSPVLCRDLVVQNLDVDGGGSRLIAVHRASGKLAWEAPRPFFGPGWSTPILWPGGGKPQLVVLGSKKLVSYDPQNGRELWAMAGFPGEVPPSPAFDAQYIFAGSAATGGRSGETFESFAWEAVSDLDLNHDGKIQIDEVPESFRFVQRPGLPEGNPGRRLPFPARDVLRSMDQNKDGAVSREEWNTAMGEFMARETPVLMALNAGSGGAGGTNRLAWKVTRGLPEVPSPMHYLGKVYLVRDGGMVQCVSAQSGTILYQDRLPASGGYTASPIAADGRVYFCSVSGTITAIDAHAEHLKVLATNTLGEAITATPAMVDDTLYVRTDRHLFAFRNHCHTRTSSLNPIQLIRRHSSSR